MKAIYTLVALFAVGIMLLFTEKLYTQPLIQRSTSQEVVSLKQRVVDLHEVIRIRTKERGPNAIG